MRFVKESVIRAAPARVFAFHELPDAMQRLLPPWESSRLVEPAPNLRVGARALIDTKLFRVFTVRWEALHTVYDPPRLFEDVQVKGPFKSWRHRHIVEPCEEGARLRDEIEYEPPLGFLGRWGASLLIVPRLNRLFDYRHRVTREWAEGRDEG